MSKRLAGGPPPINQSLQRGFSLLSLISIEPLRLSEIAERSGLAKSTTSRLLASLVALGAAKLDGDRFSIGPTVLALGGDSLDGREVLEALAQSPLRRLADEVGEHAALAVTDGMEILYVSQESATSRVQAGEWTGERHAPHAAAFGVVLLAFWDDDDRERYLTRPLVAFTDQTSTDPVRLRSRLDGVRSVGLDWSVDEFAEDVTGCAAPVYDDAGRVVASIGCFAPSYRFPGDRDRAEIEARVRAAARELSEALGDS